MDLTLATTTLCQNDASEMITALGDNFPVMVVFGTMGLVGIIGILFGTMTSMSKNREIEVTKRELAAYVAEGSMTPADAERILRSNKDA